jgi:hypothetical protein
MSDSWTPREHSAKQQDSIVPKGWVPTKDAPVPVVRCVEIKKDGERCGRWSVRGLTKCASHLRGAHKNFENVADRVQATLDSARMRLLDDADLAVDTLEALMQPGTAEAIRLKSATEILDRVGIKGGIDINVEVTDSRDPAESIRTRLERLATSTPALTATPDDDIEDAEVLADDPDQPTLF